MAHPSASLIDPQMIQNVLLINTIVLGVCGLSYFYGDPKGHRSIDKLHHLCFLSIPRYMTLFLSRVLGDQKAKNISSFFEDFFTKPNPTVFYLYLILSVGGYTLFVIYGYPELPNPVVPWEHHKVTGFLLFFVTVTLFIKSSVDDPGVITKSNHQAILETYPADGTIFPKTTKLPEICRTCSLPKPARSKHCSTCNRCIKRFDHHCIWINQCVGAGNVGSFLMFLLANNALCLYGSYLGCGIIQHWIEDLGLATAVFRDRITGEVYSASWYYIAVYMMGNHKPIVFLTMFCTIIGVVLLWFTWYHWVTLMRCGLTTNEDIKIGRIKPRVDKAMTVYNRGSWLHNCMETFSRKDPRSTIVSLGKR